MNFNPVKRIYKFNQEANLLEDGYSDERECAFPIEEALECLNTDALSGVLADGGEYVSEDNPKGISRLIAHVAMSDVENIKDVDRLDKHLDIIVFSLGSIFKLGLNPQQAMRALDVVASKNMEKLTVGKDEAGKQMKPSDFVGPEPELQKILDER